MNFLDVISIIGWVAAVLQIGQFAIGLLRFWHSRLRSFSKNDFENQAQVAVSVQPVCDDGLETISEDPGASAANSHDIPELRMRIVPKRLIVPGNKESLISETELVVLELL